MIKKLLAKFSVSLQIGFLNVLYMFWYRLSKKTGLRKIWFRRGSYRPNNRYFKESSPVDFYPDEWKKPLLQQADSILGGTLFYYSKLPLKIGSPPEWFYNPIENKRIHHPEKHWCDISDFNSDTGDIKNIWEPSRFGWAVVLSRAYKVTGNKTYLNCLNNQIIDWCKQNPLNIGPNWMSGQEASIRVFHLLTTALILDQENAPLNSLCLLIESHLKRIASNIRYAVAQNNNHGTSEAAALYIGGAWLNKLEKDGLVRCKKSQKWMKKGEKVLSARIKNLIMNDGTFSQYSIIYHRMVVDTLSFVLLWQDKLHLQPFDERINLKIRKAVEWLWYFTNEDGLAPNIGANDGTMLFPLHSNNYLDLRPSLQLANVLVNRSKLLNDEMINEPLYWLNLNSDLSVENFEKKDIKDFPEGGFLRIKNDNSIAYFRYPIFKFRPSQSDIFHFDLWHNGINILRDAGSFSYNCEELWQSYFSSVRAHNTIQFDEYDQMPKISRFLFGDWPNVKQKVFKRDESDQCVRFSFDYSDFRNNHHNRIIEKRGHSDWRIIDRFEGTFKTGTLRWRLLPDNWVKDKNSVSTKDISLSVKSDAPLYMKLTDGWESLFYWQKNKIPVFEVKFDASVKEIITDIEIKSN